MISWCDWCGGLAASGGRRYVHVTWFGAVIPLSRHDHDVTNLTRGWPWARWKVRLGWWLWKGFTRADEYKRYKKK